MAFPLRSLTILALSLSFGAAAIAQPKLVGTGMNSTSLTADGNTAAGTVFVADLELTETGSQTTAYRFTRGIGSAPMGTRRIAGGPRLSDNGLIACCDIYNNPENWSNFETLYPYPPEPTIKGHTLGGRWSSVGGWMNLGSFPNVAGLGAARCDAGINSAIDISGDGRFVIGWCHYGAFGSINCQFQPCVYDASTGVWSLMPFRNSGIQPGSLPFRASSDGRVVHGYDNGATPDPIPGVSPPIPNPRALAVWERTNVNQSFPANSETILDYFGAGDKGFLNRSGTIIAATLTSTSARYIACDTALAGTLVIYTTAAPSGACCISAASCTLTDPKACELQGGWYAGTGVACAAAACGSVQYGSCCTALRGCNITNSARCQCFGGTFVAGGICSPNPCPGSPVLSACCAGSLCRVVDETFCRALGGRPMTGVTTCSPSPCPTTAWYRVPIGRVPGSFGDMVPSGISDDGTTIVGAVDGAGFIWRATLNEGVPMYMADYLASLNGGNPFPGGGISIGTAVGSGGGIGRLSADGNAVLVTLLDNRDTCPGNATSLFTGGAAILYFDAASIPCEPPRIVLPQNLLVRNVYDRLGTALNVFASGSWPLNFEWQMAPTAAGPWTTPTESCSDFNPPFDFEGIYKPQIRIGGINHPGFYRCIVTNSCGSVTSDPAEVRFAIGACCQDIGGSVACSIQAQNVCTGSLSVGWLAGTYAGDFTTCMPTPQDPCANSSGAPISGACCVGPGGPDAQCLISVRTFCETPIAGGGYGGSFAGAGTTCSPSQCNLVSGGCCYSLSNTSDVVCTVELGARCNTNVAGGGLAGAYLGNNTTCGPSSCSTVAGACCYAASNTTDVICTIQTQTRCINLPQLPSQQNYFSGLQGIWVGAGSTCLPVNQQCGFVAGACCYSTNDQSNAICTVQLQDKCTRASNNNGLGGSYRGDGTTCTPSSCTNVTGACCYSTFNEPGTLLCTIQPQTHCTTRINAGGLFGVYMGNGTTCTPTACASGVGACCYIPNGGTCQICSLEPADSPTAATSNRCTDPVNGGLGGTFSGRNTTCGPASCGGTTGACCIPATACITGCLSDCTSQGGTFQAGVACEPNDPCAAAQQGACCRGSTCGIDTAANCVGFANGYAGNNTVCNVFGGNNVSPCCLGDYNHVGGVTVQDIFDFLAGYFSVDAKANINGGSVGVQDIFDFLAVYFAGCN